MKKLILISCLLSGLVFGPSSWAQEVDPERIYGMLCALCHGADGKPTPQGVKFGSPDFTDPNWQTSRTDEQLVESMTKGTDNPNYRPVSQLITDMLGINMDPQVFIPKVRSFVSQ